MSSSISSEVYLSFARELVKKSREILCIAFEKQKEERSKEKIEIKSDGSPVTAVDRKVELLLRKEIQKKFPGHAVWGEEFGQGAKDQESSDFLWLIDPIDGTKSFINASPFFGTLVSLLFEGMPLIGVIDMPVLKECYWGDLSTGKASFKEDAKGINKITTRSCSSLAKAALRTTSIEYFSQGKRQALRTDREVFENLQGLCRESVYGGDCYCYASLASGLTDIVLETGLAPYDFFALIPLIEGAGGKISDWQGKPLSLETKRGDILACGDPSLCETALERIKGLSGP